MKRKNQKYPHLQELYHTNRSAYLKEWRRLNPTKYPVKDEWRKLDDYTYTELPSDVIPVPNYPTYYVQPNGDVWRDTRGTPSAIKTGKERVLKLRPTYTPQNGYWLIQPYKNGKKKAIYLHRFVLTAFKGEAPLPTMECHHIDHNTSNNAIDNLMWVTRQENADFVPRQHRSVPKKTLAEGRKVSESKHSPVYPEIIELYKSGLKMTEISRKLNIGYSSIHQIVSLLKRREQL
jgi:hypothetical protein